MSLTSTEGAYEQELWAQLDMYPEMRSTTGE